MFVIKCENLRRKPDNPHAKCGRAISHLYDLKDKSYTVYCPGCKSFILVEIIDGAPSLTTIPKEDLDFTRPLACRVKGQMVKI